MEQIGKSPQQRECPFPYEPADETLGNKSFYTVWARWPDQMRLLSVEWEMIETEDEAIAVLRETPRAVVVFQHDPDVPRRDVSEDIARRWLRQRKARGYNCADLPEFIVAHLSSDEIENIARCPWLMAAE